AFGYGPGQLPSPPLNATDAPRPAERDAGCGQRLRGREAARLPRSRPSRRQLSGLVWRTAVSHSAARLTSGSGRTHARQAPHETFVTALTWLNVRVIVAAG